MRRPTVLIASTSHTMAATLKLILQEKCISLGINLELPTTTQNVFYSSDDLFEYLEEKNPYELADTLVLLDLGNVRPISAFSANAGTNTHGWHRVKHRAGVATELLLRFPQVYPVFMSLYLKSNAKAAEEISTSDNVASSNVNKGSCIDIKFDEIFSSDNVPVAKKLCSVWESINRQASYSHFVSINNYWDESIKILERFSAGKRCWFDPTGLRIFVKNYYLGKVFGAKVKSEEGADYWSWKNTVKARRLFDERLKNIAISIDEERGFALLNAYASWKFGRRAWVISTWSEFENVQCHLNDYKDIVILRDLDLRFQDINQYDKKTEVGSPEKNIKENLESGTKSDGVSIRQQLKDIYSEVWKGFLSSSPTVRVVSGAMCIADIRKSSWRSKFDRDVFRLGQERLENDAMVKYIGLSKPVGSLYDFQVVFKNENNNKRKSLIACIAPTFDVKGGNAGNHAAPYRNLAIAESLIRQSRRCTNGAEANIIGAFLASEAYEILLGMSKTTALEALLLLHNREVSAEVEFPGISHNIEIKERKYDIENSLNTLYGTGGGKSNIGRLDKNSRNAIKRNFLTQFWSELRIKYRDGEQFEAAESANVQSFVNSNWWPWQWPTLGGKTDSIVSPVKYFVLEIATSLKWWVATTILFTVLMTAWYASLSGYSFDLAGWKTFLKIWHQVVLGSLRLSPDDGLLKLSDFLEMGGFFRYLAVATHTIISYILFGLFISMLYRKATRA